MMIVFLSEHGADLVDQNMLFCSGEVEDWGGNDALDEMNTAHDVVSDGCAQLRQCK